MAISKKIKKIREDFFALEKQTHEAYARGDRPAFRKLKRDFYEYCRKFQKELKIPDEKIEGLRQGILAAEQAEAQVDYLQAEIKRLEREADEQELDLYDSLDEEQRRSWIKWN